MPRRLTENATTALSARAETRRRRDADRNHTERGLRGSVIYRKLSLVSQSEDGERRIERLLSAHTTCRLQHRSLHAYLVDVLGAHSRGGPIALLA